MKRLSILFCAAFLLVSLCCSQGSQSLRAQDQPGDLSLPESVGPSGNQQTDFFDSLNQGNEIVITREDFRSPGDSIAPDQDTVVYRVQILATTNKEVAEKEKARIQDALGIPVTLVYEEPYHKLRGGEFQTHEQAEKFKQQMIDIGHVKAWIVREMKTPR